MKNTLLKALLKSKSDTKETTEALIDTYLKEVAKSSRKQTEQLVSELIVYVLKHVEDTDKKVLLQVVEEKISQLGYTIPTQSLEEIYKKSAEAAAVGVGASFVFEQVDADVLSSMYRAVTWMKEDGTQRTQQLLKETIAEAMEGEFGINELGEVLRSRLSDRIDESSRYFQSVSEHIIRQSQSLGRIEQFAKAGVKEVKVKAVIDSRTSAICRSMNGRIIPLSHAMKQADAILAAQSVEEKKQVARWQSKPIFGKLPPDVALPPYHFRCRTIVVAFFRQKRKIDGKNVNGSYVPGETYKGKKVLFSHIDRFGYERVITEKTPDHGGHNHGIAHKEYIAGLNSLEAMALHADNPLRTVGYSRDKNLFFVFEDEEVITAYRPDNGERHFKQAALDGTIESISIKKGEEDENM